MKKKELFLTSLFLFVDLGSKAFMENLLKTQSIDILPNFFRLELTYNTGAAWSIFEDQIFLFIGIGFVSLFLLAFFKESIVESKMRDISFSLLYAGIMGNLMDRIIFSHVIDFLSFHIFHYAFPIFNFADVFIVIGTFFIFIEILKGDKSWKQFMLQVKKK